MRRGGLKYLHSKGENLSDFATGLHIDFRKAAAGEGLVRGRIWYGICNPVDQFQPSKRSFSMKQSSKPTRPISIHKSGKKGHESPAEGPTGKLIVIYGDRLGKQYRLGQNEMLIGRMDRSDILIDDSSVSREHARIERKDGRFILEDLKSTNGTCVNGEFVDVRVLNHGDKIRIGNTVLQLIIEG